MLFFLLHPRNSAISTLIPRCDTGLLAMVGYNGYGASMNFRFDGYG